MNTLVTTILVALTVIATDALCQKGPARYFGEPILADSASTLFIPTRYNEEFMSSNKIALWGDYYANIVAYNFETDSYQKVFDRDTYIEPLRNVNERYPYAAGENGGIKNITAKWIFLIVKFKDTNGNGRIDQRDPSILFAVSTNGQALRQLTEETENVVSFDTYEKQGFVFIKVQKDSDNDRSFKDEDKEFYFRKINLSDLTAGQRIQIN